MEHLPSDLSAEVWDLCGRYQRHYALTLIQRSWERSGKWPPEVPSVAHVRGSLYCYSCDSQDHRYKQPSSQHSQSQTMCAQGAHTTCAALTRMPGTSGLRANAITLLTILLKALNHLANQSRPSRRLMAAHGLWQAIYNPTHVKSTQV